MFFCPLGHIVDRGVLVAVPCDSSVFLVIEASCCLSGYGVCVTFSPRSCFYRSFHFQSVRIGGLTHMRVWSLLDSEDASAGPFFL